jgi:hypothetical protein
MNTWIKVGRYHLTNRLILWIPWAALAFSLAINLVIFAAVPDSAVPTPHTWGIATIFVFLFISGLFSSTRLLPFALALGLTRRAYFIGTALFDLALAAVDGLGLTLLQALERGTGGWGENVNFFRVPWILDGPWYLTWLTSFVLLALVFVYGIWYGLVYRRWNLIGLLAFGAAQVTVVAAVAVIATWTHTWGDLGDFFGTLSAAGFTGVLAVLVAVLLAGGFSTMRRVTV